MTKLLTKPLHTLNARDNVMLEVIRRQFNVSPEQMHKEIQALRHLVEEALARKGVSYDRLKTALIPSTKRREIALVFDSKAIDSSWYGYDIFKRLIPLFDRKSNHSILAGDYLGDNESQSMLFMAMNDAVTLRREVDFEHSTQFFIVYINNLTETMVRLINEGLTDYRAYVGYADTTYSSVFKLLISTMLVNVCVKHGSIIIQCHEDDLDLDEDVNTSGYPFEENGYICRSVPSYLEGTLLSYKIERPVIEGFEEDLEFSLNAISASPLPFTDFKVCVEDAKLAYLKCEKVGSMSAAGLENVSNVELAARIREKVLDNYIYNMAFDAEHNVHKFNIIIELPSVNEARPIRLLAALEYQAVNKVLRLITLY
ncbi:hypothetical protein [Oceanibaculum sp.]|uniref:hypothetical protein n=1 Tax=Oceanibaculum sp. TaxID=1903597 RepID=UPI002588B9F0|nr:hypothetical protein [Oceanibaculum sp.]MCH2393191.1 hypothetical protein [Oceanibaculum sp.]